MSAFYGHNGYAELKPVSAWDPRRGWSITRRFKGLQSSIDALALTLIASGVRFTREVMPDGGYHILSATYGAEESQSPTEPLSDLWDLDGNDIEQSLWLRPSIKAHLEFFLDESGFPTDSYVAITRDIQELVSGTKLPSDIAWWGDKDPHTPELKKFARELLRGVDSYHVSEWVLRRRRVIARNSTIQPSNAYVNMLFMTTSKLRAVEGVPSNLPFTLPDGVWLKKSPKRTQIASDKWEISQEYWWGENYSTFAYDAVP